MQKALAIDVGEKRVGLAMSDELGIIASPYGYVERDEAIEKIIGIAAQENVGLFVVGLPFLPSGKLGSQASDVKQFVDMLHEKTSIGIDFENEVLTSVEAGNRLKNIRGSKFEKGDVDAMAATIILESYLRRAQS